MAAMPRDLSAPAIVIAHGAWADATNWREVIALLQAKGLRVVAVQNPLTALADDVDAVTRALNSSEPISRPFHSRICRAALTHTPLSESTSSTGSNFSGMCSSGRMSVQPSAMPPCGSHSASPIPSGCVIETRSALWSRRLCRAAWTERRLRPTSRHGRRRISKRTTGRRFVRWRRPSCWVFTRATLRAIRSAQRSLRHGKKSGAPAARDVLQASER